MSKVYQLNICLIGILYLLSYRLAYSTENDIYRMGYLAYYASYSQSSLMRYYSDYESLAVTGYSISSDCSVKILKPAFHKRCTEIFKQKFLPVLTLSSPQNGISILKSPSKRILCAEKIISFLDVIGYTQVQFDFEYIPSEYNDEYGLLLAELKRREPDVFVSVCIAPQVDSIPKYAGFFDVRVLDNYADEFMLMSYDYYGPLRKHGPVTDIFWTERNIRYLLSHTSPLKLILGAPLYGYWWDNKGKEHVFTERSFYRKFPRENIVRMKEGTVTLRDLKNTPYRSLSVGDRGTLMQFEKLINTYKLKGLGIWRLGFEEK